MRWSSPLPRLSFHHYYEHWDPFWGALYKPRQRGYPDSILYLHFGFHTVSIWLTWPERSTP